MWERFHLSIGKPSAKVKLLVVAELPRYTLMMLNY